MNHQYQSNYNPSEFCDVVDVCFNGRWKCLVTIYRKRGAPKTKTVYLKEYCFSGPWANYHKVN